MSNERELGEFDRRLANLIKVGIVGDVSGDRATVIFGGVESAPLRWTTRNAGEDSDWAAPSPGAQVVVLSPSGDLAQGVISSQLSSSAFPAPSASPTVRKVRFRDGTTIEYDTEAHTLVADIAGDAVIRASGTVTIEASDVRLGSAGAADGVVRQSDLQSAISSVQAWADLHVHVAPTGPTLVPTALLGPQSVGSSSTTKSD